MSQIAEKPSKKLKFLVFYPKSTYRRTDMKYLAIVTLSAWAKIERLFDTEREAQIWAFEQEGTAQILPVEADYGKALMSQVVAMYAPKTQNNQN